MQRTLLIAAVTAAAALMMSGRASATLIPIGISGFDQDVIVEAESAVTDVQGLVTATMEGGTAKTGGTFYERGFVFGNTGLPAGTFVASATGNGMFELQSEFGSNVLLLNNASPAGTLTLTTPASYSQLGIFDATGSGSGTIGYTIRFVGGATETGTFTSPDWFDGTPAAFVAAGRVSNVFTGNFDNVGSANPRLYEHLLTVTNTSDLIQSISLTRATAGGHTGVFALSGNPVPEPTVTCVISIGGAAVFLRRTGRRAGNRACRAG